MENQNNQNDPTSNGVDANNDQQPTEQKLSDLTAADLARMIGEVSNKVYSERERRAANRAAKAEPVKEKDDSTNEETSLTLKRLNAKIDQLNTALDNERKAATEVKLMQTLEASLKGKVIADFEDVVAERLRKAIKLEDGEMSAVIDGVEYYDLSSITEQFLKHNPKFKAPKAQPAVALTKTTNQTTPRKDTSRVPGQSKLREGLAAIFADE